MIKIPRDLQYKLSASYHVNSFQRTVEELVYNALDAGSNSIAIRVNIQENSLQVVDNGCGINRNDFDLLGQRYTTSKFNSMTIKSIPTTYGFRGLSLASIIEVARDVKIVSRCLDSTETWSKIFHKGNCTEITEIALRPSKGTTVEIYGLLYNLKIQRKNLDSCNEFLAIKTLLEQFSLLHINVSFSLRNDGKNEIIFKIHKNRDIFQTLSSIFNIPSNVLQEIIVEKNQYKVRAFIEKKSVEMKRCHWIFLNGRYISKTNLNKIVNKAFKKYLHLGKNKANKVHIDELLRQDTPTYFLFISCPYSDYDINFDIRKTIIEFKNWDRIRNLLEKLVQCYFGDVKLKEITKNRIIDKEFERNKNSNTRKEVKRIMEKFLTKNRQNQKVALNMCNGVKGKSIKRKHLRNDKLRMEPCNINNFKISSINKKLNDIRLCKLNTKNDINSIEKTNQKTQKLKIDVKNNNKIMSRKRRTENMPLISKFTNENADIGLRHKLPVKATKKNRQRHKVTVNEQNKFNITGGDVGIKINESIDDPDFLQHKFSKLGSDDCIIEKYDDVIRDRNTGTVITSYDLVKTVFNSNNFSSHLAIEYNQRTNFRENRQFALNNSEYFKSKGLFSTKLTYESHNYMIGQEINKSVNNLSKNMIFRSKCFRDNSVTKNNQIKTKCSKRLDTQKNIKNRSIFNKLKMGFEQSLYTIHDVSNSFYRTTIKRYPKLDLSSNNKNFTKHVNILHSELGKDKITEEIGMTYTIGNNASGIGAKDIEISNHEYQFTYSIQSSKLCTHASKAEIENREIDSVLLENVDGNLDPIYTKSIEENNFKYTGEIKKNTKIMTSESLDPLNVCETIFSTSNMLNNSNFNPIPSKNIEMNNYISNVGQDNDKLKRISSECLAPVNLSETIYGTPDSLNKHNLCQTLTKDIGKDHDLSGIEKVSDNIKNISSEILDAISLCEIIYNTPNTSNRYNVSQKLIKNIEKHHDVSGVEKIIDEVRNKNSETSDLLNVCKTIHNSSKDFYGRKSNYILSSNNNLIVGESEKEVFQRKDEKKNSLQNDAEENKNILSHHFNTEEMNEIFLNTFYSSKIKETGNTINKVEGHDPIVTVINKKLDNFNMKSRYTFVPKGMSPIFNNCNHKTTHPVLLNINDEYYKDAIYKNFAEHVIENVQIFEPKIHNVNEVITNDVNKLNNKMKQDNADLIFDARSIKNAKVLGQVDCKFIITALPGKTVTSMKFSNFLVLFDQHAVHERIRLEENLSEYFDGNIWKSVNVDVFSFKLCKDDVLFLHNHKDKLIKFGLEWSIADEIISIYRIPKAISGKIPRDLDVVVKATKCLLTELIEAIKSLKGNIPIYPQAIMSLVFSEACRYAIMFGNRLSKSNCVTLIQSLSECKTPFQCAHGRPVMAVIIELSEEKPSYKIDISKVLHFNLRKKCKC